MRSMIIFAVNCVLLLLFFFRTEGTTTPNETPSSARKVLGSIERGLSKVRHVLTPRRRVAVTADRPTVLGTKVREAPTSFFKDRRMP